MSTQDIRPVVAQGHHPAVKWLFKLQGFASAGAQKKGWDYFFSGAVHLTLATPDRVKGLIAGSPQSKVDIFVEGHDVLVDCTCPYFNGFGLCKHLWAVLAAAEKEGTLSRIGELDKPKCSSAFEYRDIRGQTKAAAKTNIWKQHLEALRVLTSVQKDTTAGKKRRIVYVVDREECLSSCGLIVRAAACQLKKNGEWGRPNFHESTIREVQWLEPSDAKILSLLSGSRGIYQHETESASTFYRVSRGSQEVLIPMLCETGRFCFKTDHSAEVLHPLSWDDGAPWIFQVGIRRNEAAGSYEISATYRRDSVEIPINEAPLVTHGFVFFKDRVARLDDGGAYEWLSFLRRTGNLTVPLSACSELMGEIAKFHNLPRMELPEELRIEARTPDAPPDLRIRAPERTWAGAQPKLRCEIIFNYGAVKIPESNTNIAVEDPALGRFFLRDRAAEGAWLARLAELGVRPASWQGHQWELQQSKLPALVRTLVSEGWLVEAEGKLYRRNGKFSMHVRSGIDWFELEARADFDGHSVKMPELLKASARGEEVVQLGDGSFGIVPEEWIKRYRFAAGFAAEGSGERLRFAPHQAGLLDALLACEPAATFDAGFHRVRQELESFGGVGPTDSAPTFNGQLRAYQREGLGWLLFLRRFGFGGCLADDMGLGKTIQVLALLDSNHRKGPALIVVPRSLVFNWKQEACRFAPQLRVLDHTGAGRRDRWEDIRNHDIVLTTYGTLRRDATLLKDIHFDMIVLDEAQAIKNATTESAKAVRLLKGDHRLVLTGTPVENRMADLWSLFEFLNPGMLGSASAFRVSTAGKESGSDTTISNDSAIILSKALRPFILRRTKEQVAKELPPKTEQTIYCELDQIQRTLYDELRTHYRESLLGRIEQIGIEKSRMHILEALLRLRQAACHPGLIDKKRAHESSAKLDALLPQLAEVAAEGHKALIFSQFTSFLAILRNRLDSEKIPYEYLDGKTRDRQSPVRRFQETKDCQVFLMSLKAGGLGLNLTAAEYVFLLDPWWNPAVEAQAIDRCHRIGQFRHVFAYRLIARDTVEEKVLELQKMKREIADAIITADNSVLAGLSREHLELLLS